MSEKSFSTNLISNVSSFYYKQLLLLNDPLLYYQFHSLLIHSSKSHARNKKANKVGHLKFISFVYSVQVKFVAVLKPELLVAALGFYMLHDESGSVIQTSIKILDISCD